MVYGFTLIWFNELFVSDWWELKRSKLFFFGLYMVELIMFTGKLESSYLIQFTVLLYRSEVWFIYKKEGVASEVD